MLFNMGQIFPISDVPSARLMKLKAACLFRAGVLTGLQRAFVARRANEVLARTPISRPRQPACNSRAA